MKIEFQNSIVPVFCAGYQNCLDKFLIVNEQERGGARFAHYVFGVAYYWRWLLMSAMTHDNNMKHYYYNYRKDIRYYVTRNMEDEQCRYER